MEFFSCALAFKVAQRCFAIMALRSVSAGLSILSLMKQFDQDGRFQRTTMSEAAYSSAR